MLETVTLRHPIDGVVIITELLVLTIGRYQFILAANQYIEVSA